MLKFWEKMLWFLFILSVIAIVTNFVLVKMDVFIIPFWVPLSACVGCVTFGIYQIKKEKMLRLSGKEKELDATFKKIQRMSAKEKTEFAISENAVYYFEKVEEVKEVITTEEFSKYKTVLFGTEDPYIVTEEGKILVKACPGDFKEKQD
jgi:hypothetical protein